MNHDEKSLGVGTGLVLMVALGVLAFGGLGALGAKRFGAPLRPQLITEPAKPGDPFAALREGTGSALQIALTNFRADRPSHAVMALDAARRCARVGRDAGAPGYAPLLGQIEESRQAVQDGSRASAADMLVAATRTFAAAAPTGRETVASGGRPRDWAKYRGALVINARGVRVGEIASIADDAVVALGGKRDVFGFVDLGGTRVHVPLAKLIASATSGRGLMTVMLPVFSSEPEGIRAELTTR